MLKYALPAAAGLLAATSASAQEGAGGMAASIEVPAKAFGECLKTGIAGVSATVTPEAGASSVLAGCASQKTALETAADAMIAGLPITDAQKAEIRTQMKAEFAKAETQIADAIRKRRAAPAAAK